MNNIPDFKRIETETPPRSDADGLGGLLNQVHNMDCVELMRSMPSESVSVVFADPPFNLNKKYASYKDNMPFGEYMAWTAEWLAEAGRLHLRLQHPQAAHLHGGAAERPRRIQALDSVELQRAAAGQDASAGALRHTFLHQEPEKQVLRRPRAAQDLPRLRRLSQRLRRQRAPAARIRLPK